MAGLHDPTIHVHKPADGYRAPTLRALIFWAHQFGGRGHTDSAPLAARSPTPSSSESSNVSLSEHSGSTGTADWRDATIQNSRAGVLHQPGPLALFAAFSSRSGIGQVQTHLPQGVSFFLLVAFTVVGTDHVGNDSIRTALSSTSAPSALSVEGYFAIAAFQRRYDNFPPSIQQSQRAWYRTTNYSTRKARPQHDDLGVGVQRHGTPGGSELPSWGNGSLGGMGRTAGVIHAGNTIDMHGAIIDMPWWCNTPSRREGSPSVAITIPTRFQ